MLQMYGVGLGKAISIEESEEKDNRKAKHISY